MSTSPTGPVGIRPITFEPGDFSDPQKFAVFSEWIDQVTTNINTLFGLHGDIPMFANIDMQGSGTIKNLAAPTASGDAVSHGAAQAAFGAAAIQPQIEATGNAMLQTTRRLNDRNQQEQFSTFLNTIMNIPPSTNASNVTVVSLGGGSSQITVTANSFTLADLAVLPYAQRQDTVTNPSVGSNFYYYYVRKSDNTLQFVGPFTTQMSANNFQANIDGRGYVAQATVVAAGGGTGGGGGDPPVRGGCLEVGTPISVPEGKQFNFFVEPCSDWITVKLKDGRRIKAARGTMMAVFVAVENLRINDLAKGVDGSMNPVEGIEISTDGGFKMHATVEGGVYGGEGIEFHNNKIPGL